VAKATRKTTTAAAANKKKKAQKTGKKRGRNGETKDGTKKKKKMTLREKVVEIVLRHKKASLALIKKELEALHGIDCQAQRNKTNLKKALESSQGAKVIC